MRGGRPIGRGRAIAVFAALLSLLAAATVFGEPWTTLIVDAEMAVAQPAEDVFPTISAAVDAAEDITAQGTRVRIRVSPGVYRESVIIDGSQQDAAMSISGATSHPQDVVITGADVFTDWSPLTDAPEVLVHAWPHEWGLAAFPTQGWQDYFEDNDVTDVARRQEAVWVDGEVVRQVLTRDEVIAQPDTFFVDEASDRLLFHPAGALRPNSIEVAVREAGLHVSNRREISLSGITVERVATPLQHSAVTFANSTNITVENAQMQWNSWGGLALQRVRDGVIRGVSTSTNGVIGLTIYQTEDVEIIDVDNLRNNTWRGVWARYLGWENGAKVFEARRLRFSNWTAQENAAVGLWLDTDVADVTIDGAVLANNWRAGLFLEAIQGPVLVRDAVICGNGEDGILDGKSDRVMIEGSRVFGNAGAQLLFSGAPGGRPVTTYDTATEMNIRSQGWTLRDNTIAAGDGADLIQSHLDSADWDVLAASLASNQNNWSAPQAYEFHAAGDAHDLEGWRALTGEDADSTFAMQPPPGDCPS